MGKQYRIFITKKEILIHFNKFGRPKKLTTLIEDRNKTIILSNEEIKPNFVNTVFWT